MKNCKVFFIISGCLLLLAHSNAFSEDIMQVYSDAASGSLRFKSASVDYQIAEARKKEIMAEYDPQLNLRVTPSYTFSDHNKSRIRNGRVINNNSNDVEINYSLGLTKPIYNRQLNARIYQANSMLEQEDALFDLEKQALIARVAESYFNFLAAQNKLNYSLSEKSTIQQNLDQLRVLFRVKRSTITDIKETELNLHRANSAIATAQNELERAQKNLRVITGRTYRTLATPDTNRQMLKLVSGSVNDWVHLSLNNSLEIFVAKHQLEIQKKDINIQRTGKSTTVDLFARYEGSNTFGGSSSNKSSDRDGKVGFDINIPLFTGNKISSRVLGANFKYKKAQYDLELVKRKTIENVKFFYQTVMTDIDNIHALKRAVNSSEKTLLTLQQGRLVGTRTMSDVLFSLKESFRVKRQYNDARYKYLFDTIQLKQAAGILSIQDLQRINGLFKHPIHFKNQYPQDLKFTNITPLPEIVRPPKKIVSLEDAWEL